MYAPGMNPLAGTERTPVTGSAEEPVRPREGSNSVAENIVLTRDERVQLATDYLIERGIKPGPNGWDEETLAKAIRDNRWRYRTEGMTGEWSVYVVKRDDRWGTDESIADDEDRITAMMLALVQLGRNGSVV